MPVAEQPEPLIKAPSSDVFQEEEGVAIAQEDSDQSPEPQNDDPRLAEIKANIAGIKEAI